FALTESFENVHCAPLFVVLAASRHCLADTV
ncbi:hypothetical protein MGSAQ_003139, partial [marine sediment metagenome]